jgi:hypothetical protein
MEEWRSYLGLVPPISDIHEPRVIDRNALRFYKLPEAVARATPSRDEVPHGVKLFNSIVAGVYHVNVIAVIHCDVPGKAELARRAAQ